MSTADMIRISRVSERFLSAVERVAIVRHSHRMKVLVAAIAVALVACVGANAATSPGFLGCKAFTAPHSRLQVRPASIVAACGDGNFYFTRIHWTSWKATAATGGGVAHQNGCTPNCAAGKFQMYLARVRLSAVKHCHGRTEFTKLSWTFAAARPKGVPRSSSKRSAAPSRVARRCGGPAASRSGTGASTVPSACPRSAGARR